MWFWPFNRKKQLTEQEKRDIRRRVLIGARPSSNGTVTIPRNINRDLHQAYGDRDDFNPYFAILVNEVISGGGDSLPSWSIQSPSPSYGGSYATSNQSSDDYCRPDPTPSYGGYSPSYDSPSPSPSYDSGGSSGHDSGGSSSSYDSSSSSSSSGGDY